MKTARPLLPSLFILMAIPGASAAAIPPKDAPAQTPASAEHAARGELVKPGKADADWLKKARASYPLTTCPVSGSRLDAPGMGPSLNYIYREPGKTDRLVVFCCEGCVAAFRKNPEKFLRKIDEAAAARDKKMAKPDMAPKRD